MNTTTPREALKEADRQRAIAGAAEDMLRGMRLNYDVEAQPAKKRFWQKSSIGNGHTWVLDFHESRLLYEYLSDRKMKAERRADELEASVTLTPETKETQR